MLAGKRLWRTADGGLVEDGHVDAEVLAYAPGDRIDARDEAKAAGEVKEPSTVDEITAAVGADAVRAREYLDAEQAKEKPRAKLVKVLEGVIATGTRGGD